MMNGSRTIALTGGNRRYYLAGIGRVQEVGLKAMLHETIRNEGFLRNTALQHCCDIVSNSYSIVPTLQRCVALETVVANITMHDYHAPPCTTPPAMLIFLSC